MKDRIVVLRHDHDRIYSVGNAMDICLGIERDFGVRSTCFLRYDRGIGNDISLKDKFFDYQEEGWEFGFHLSNHVAHPDQNTPEYELEILSKLGLNMTGVSLCGSVNPVYDYHELQRDIVDSLKMQYFSPHLEALPVEEFKTPVLPEHVCFENYIHKKNPFDLIVDALEIYLKNDKDVTLMTHPDYLCEIYIEKRNKNWGHNESAQNNIILYRDLIEYLSETYTVMNCKNYYDARIK